MCEKRKCRICGKEFEVEVGKRGRPQEYCTKDCKDLETFYIAMQKRLREVIPNMDHHAKKRWQGELFRLRNEIK